MASICILLAVAVVGGFIAGSASERRKLLKRFLLGIGITAFSCLFVIYVAFDIIAAKEIILLLLKQQTGLDESLSRHLPLSIANIPDSTVWLLLFLLILSVFFMYLIAFNCRKTVKNPLVALAGILCSGLILNFCFNWAFIGLSTFLVLCRNFSTGLPILPGIATSLILASVLLIAWTLYSFFGKKSGWKRLLVQLASAAGICAVCWSLGLAVALPYGYYAENSAEQAGISPFGFNAEFSPEQQEIQKKIDGFWEEHKSFEPPIVSVYRWRKDACKEYGSLISEDRKIYTLQLFNTQEMNDILSTYEMLIKPFVSDLPFPFEKLNYIRSYARLRAGRAALFLETEEPDKILPELMSITILDQKTFCHTQNIISELVRIAVRSTWYNNMVKLGPDGKKYARIYREALVLMKSREVRIPSETGFYLDMLLDCKPDSYANLISYPLTRSFAAKGILTHLALQSRLAELEKQEVLGEDYSDNEIFNMFHRAALKGRSSIVMGTIALALKLYRSEHGIYPDKLGDIVPEYLDKISVCPYTGQSLRYKSDGRRFELEFPHEEWGPIQKITSDPEY